MKVCKEEFCYVYEADISPICSVPTVCDLNRKFQHYSDQLEKNNDELTEKKKGLDISAAEESSEATSVDSCIEAGQKSPPRKNILDFSCSDECTCDRCTDFNSLSTHLMSQFRISSNLLGIQPLFKECPELISIPVKIRSN